MVPGITKTKILPNNKITTKENNRQTQAINSISSEWHNASSHKQELTKDPNSTSYSQNYSS